MKEIIHDIEKGIDAFSQSIKKKLGYDHPIRIDCYLGYGCNGQVRLRGRVLADQEIHQEENQGRIKNAMDMLHRYNSNEVPDATLRIRFGDQDITIKSDEEGYYDYTLNIANLPDDQFWHTATVEILTPLKEGQKNTVFEAAFQHTTDNANLCIISDIDDTIIYTGATNLFEHTQVVMLNNAKSRRLFPGMSAFLNRLTHQHHKRTQPLFFLSSSPWNLHELFCDIFEFQGIPSGSFFLKDFGIDDEKFIKSGHGEHKRSKIEMLLETYPNLEFILIGDSGQKDVEIYAEIIKKHAPRIKACYIRDVSPDRDDERDLVVQKIAEQSKTNTGHPMILAQSSLDMAEHAKMIGIFNDDDVAAVQTAEVEMSGS